MSASDFLRFLHSQLFVTLPSPTESYAGKTVIVTGSSSGLGKEGARHYARLGASKLVLAVRNIEKGVSAKEDIETTTQCAKDVIEVWKIDMANYESVKSFAKKVNDELERLDVVIANAGLNPRQYVRAEEDDSAITVNVVSTFLLMALLMPKLKATAAETITRPTFTIVSSDAHRTIKFDLTSVPECKIFSTLNNKERVNKDGQDQYGISKLIQLMCLRQLADKHPASIFPVTLNAVNPGLCRSGMTDSLDSLGFRIMIAGLARPTEEGSRALVHAGAQGFETHGKYLSEYKVKDPSSFLLTEQGRLVQGRVWVELERKLEGIWPGATSNF